LSTPRIDKLAPGTGVVLSFAGKYTESALFVGITGTGDQREADFVSINNSGRVYEWSAYRYNGSWAYGSSAERLSLVFVNDTDL
jgi:hypothetical protein